MKMNGTTVTTVVPGMGNQVVECYDAEMDDEDSDTDSMESNSTTEEDTTQLPTTVIVISVKNKKTQQNELFRVLLDSGSSRCMGTAAAIKRAGVATKKGKRHSYSTAAGSFTTTQAARLSRHKILGLNSRRVLRGLKLQVTTGKLGMYDFIFGRDYMNRYGIDIMFSDKTITWDGMKMPMKKPEEIPLDLAQYERELQLLEEEGENDALDSFAQQILDSKYEEQDLLRIAKDQNQLSEKEQQSLYELLHRYEELFKGTLGEWPDDEVSIELKPDATPYHCGKPIRIPHIHLETLKKEIDRLLEIGVLEVVEGSNAGPWCAPSFIIPKKDGRVRFITDYRELNKHIRRKPWPMPHIMDMIQDIGSFTYVTALDLSMGYYHFRLDDKSSEMSTFVLPFGIYKYRRLPMGLNISPDIFQEKMSRLFADLPFVKIYLDDVLIFSDGTLEDHLKKVEEVLS